MTLDAFADNVGQSDDFTEQSGKTAAKIHLILQKIHINQGQEMY